MTDVQGNVGLLRFFAIDHVMESFVNLLKTTATIGAILAYNSPKTVWRPGSARTRWGRLSAPLAAIEGLLLRGWEGRGEKGREVSREKGRGWGGKKDGMRGEGKGREMKVKERRGEEGRGKLPP